LSCLKAGRTHRLSSEVSHIRTLSGLRFLMFKCPKIISNFVFDISLIYVCCIYSSHGGGILPLWMKFASLASGTNSKKLCRSFVCAKIDARRPNAHEGAAPAIDSCALRLKYAQEGLMTNNWMQRHWIFGLGLFCAVTVASYAQWFEPG